MGIAKLDQLPAPVLLLIIQAQIEVKKVNNDLDKITKIFSDLAKNILEARGLRILITKSHSIICKCELGKTDGHLVSAPFPSGVLEVFWNIDSESSGKLPLINLLTQIFSVTYADAFEFSLIQDSIENSLNGFDIVNSKGEFIYANKAYMKMWRYDNLDELLKTNPGDHCADPETPIKIITALKEKGECFIEFLAKRKDGSTFNVLMWARLAHSSDGSEIYPTSSIDITSMKKVENDLRESIRSRDEFLSVVSHELKTPLTTLKINSEVRTRNIDKGMVEKFSFDKLKKLFASDNNQIDRITRLIDDMLDISRIATGKLHLKPETFNFCGMIAEVIEHHREQFIENKVEISFNCIEDIIGSWDRFRIEQVLSNLLTNALKYGNKKPVEVQVARDNDMVILKVIDQGPGIANENQQRIFDRFERAIAPNEISGLGLGLYITKHIVEMHHGSIEVLSALNSGSTFIVRLPINSI